MSEIHKVWRKLREGAMKLMHDEVGTPRDPRRVPEGDPVEAPDEEEEVEEEELQTGKPIRLVSVPYRVEELPAVSRRRLTELAAYLDISERSALRIAIATAHREFVPAEDTEEG